TERPGLIRVVKNGRLDPKAVATLTVAARGESGLMGLALDPEFAKNGHLYTCYTMERRGSGALINRVVRFAVRGGLATDEHVLIDDMLGNVFHDGCRLKFGPDGKLYVTMGDAGQDRLAQQRDSLAGKSGDGRFVAPLIESGRDTWAPSGIAILGDHLYVTALRGKRLLRFRLSGDGVVADGDWLKGTHGRLRDVVVGPDGALYVATS